MDEKITKIAAKADKTVGAEISHKADKSAGAEISANRLSLIEKLAREIEAEKDFDRSVAKFTEAAELIKSALAEGKQQKGRVFEIIKEIDGFVEREIKAEENC